MSKITLNISHSIFLTKEERYDLIDGKDIYTVGTSIPVWFYKGSTSEPANEIFCKYKLTNKQPNRLIKQVYQGYELNTPQEAPKDGSDGFILEDVPTVLDLKDPEDGGSGWLIFKQIEKASLYDRPIKITHCVEIKPIEELS